MGNQVQKQQIQRITSLPNGNAKFAEILDRQLSQFSDAEIQAFLDNVVDQVDSEYEKSPPASSASPSGPLPEPDVITVATSTESSNFMVQKIPNLHSMYHVEDQISCGSSCEVVKAREYSTGNVYAVKKMLKSKHFNTRLFKTEVEMLSKLDHPNVVQIKGHFVDKHRYYVATEYLSGGTLFDHLLRETIFEEEEAVDFLRPILQGLSYIHAQGIAHRDIKCKNMVFAEPDGRLKLIDFGDSVNAKDPHRRWFDFLSPESATERSGDTLMKSDMWAVGVVAYLLVCGRPPFGGKTRKSALRKIMAYDGNLVYPSHLDGLLSEECRSFIEALLNPDPEQRPSAAEAMKHEWIADKAFCEEHGHEVDDGMDSDEDCEVNENANLSPNVSNSSNGSSSSMDSSPSLDYSQDSANSSASTELNLVPSLSYGQNSDPTLSAITRLSQKLPAVAPLVNLQEDEETDFEDFDFEQLDHLNLDEFLDELERQDSDYVPSPSAGDKVTTTKQPEMVRIASPDFIKTPPTVSSKSQFVYCDDEYEMSPAPPAKPALRSMKSDGVLFQ